MKPLTKIRREITTLCRSDPDIYSIGHWSGNELELILQNLDKGYISFELNSDDSKYRVKTTFCLPEYNGCIFSV